MSTGRRGGQGLAGSLRNWALTVPFLVSFGLALVAFDVAARLTRPFSLRAFEVVMAALQKTLISVFRICGTRVVVERSERIVPHTGYAVIANHQSLFDIALLGGILFSNYPKYVAKKELGRWIPSISLNLRRGGNAVIDRSSREQAVEAIAKMAADAQARGVSVVIFPEGTRSRTGDLGPFKPAGALTMLAAADALEVIPAVIDGSWRLLSNNLLPVPFGTVVRIHLGDPIERSPGDAAQVLDQAERYISSTLESWRSEATLR